jgi:hypothetical protein
VLVPMAGTVVGGLDDYDGVPPLWSVNDAEQFRDSAETIMGAALPSGR